MSARSCGCTTETCGCCEGTKATVPAAIYNRPGLEALQYRVGTHAGFLETMKARLGNLPITAPGADNQTLQTFYPLTGLTTRDPSDPAIALLDAWATVGDALTFYQERIANEGFLRTATERRSVLELARLVGYTLRPGVAAGVYLAYTLEDKQVDPVPIPVGARSQSIPGPGELPQFFETSDPIEARREWNNLQVRLTRPQSITFDNALELTQLYVSGTGTNLKAGDSLLFDFGITGQPREVVRKVAGVEAQFDAQRTLVKLQAVPPKTLKAVADLRAFVLAAQNTPAAATEGQATLQFIAAVLTQVRLGVPFILQFVLSMFNQLEVGDINDFKPAFAVLLAALGAPPQPPPAKTLTDPDEFIPKLLIPPVEQARSAVHLQRSLSAAFQSKTDVHPAMLIRFAPKLRDQLYTAWSTATVSEAQPALQGVYVFRVETPLFGSGVLNMPKYNSDHELETQDKWTPWTLNEEATSLFLDQARDGVMAGSFVLVDAKGLRQVKRPAAAQTVQRTDYGISGKTTRLDFADAWRSPSTTIDAIRGVLVFAQSDQLELEEEPLPDDVSGSVIELAELYEGLTSGRWIVLTGERSDIEGVTGVKGTELLMVSGLTQDATIPGDSTHTTLTLATKTAYQYKRDGLKIYANVVKATHGETKPEILGSGDGSAALQSFALKQPPLTFVSSPDPSGVDSTLQIFVNNVEWHETETLSGLGPKNRNFVTKIDDKDVISVIFGNGVQGSRLPTGVQNVNAVYRSGIGKGGNVKAEQISMLVSRPLGVREVINPLQASGGADREDLVNARANTPLAMMALDRLVSIEDYGFFSRTFAGIGKAAARRISNGRQQIVHVTIAGADDAPIETTSDLYRNLVSALELYGGADIAIQVELRELVILVASIQIKIDPDYRWDDVSTRVRAAILDRFGFDRRSLGQPALLCELIVAVQAVEGVVYLDVDAFGGIPEKVADAKGNRTLLTMGEIASRVENLTKASTQTGKLGQPVAMGVSQRVDVNQADLEKGQVRPAQLAVFTSAVQDTLVLNQIL
ncbi:MAG: putative baseplate assembly protein [Betaproteobacteria bacterium]|nr:putative baseplate assembly protein [Betaproteobacteria bacterium]